MSYPADEHEAGFVHISAYEGTRFVRDTWLRRLAWRVRRWWQDVRGW